MPKITNSAQWKTFYSRLFLSSQLVTSMTQKAALEASLYPESDSRKTVI
jgi:hypothetical protein